MQDCQTYKYDSKNKMSDSVWHLHLANVSSGKMMDLSLNLHFFLNHQKYAQCFSFWQLFINMSQLCQWLCNKKITPMEKHEKQKTVKGLFTPNKYVLYYRTSTSLYEITWLNTKFSTKLYYYLYYSHQITFWKLKVTKNYIWHIDHFVKLQLGYSHKTKNQKTSKQ